MAKSTAQKQSTERAGSGIQLSPTYLEFCKGNFDKVDTQIKEHRAEVNKRLDTTDERIGEQTDAVMKLRETVNNGLTQRMELLVKLFFWFFGVFITVTGISFSLMLWILKLVNEYILDLAP